MRLPWRKKDEGFEWKDYVRTTILIRRNERRQKVEEAKQAAIFGVKQAGRKGADAGVAGVEAVGRAGKAAGAALGRGGRAAGSAVGSGASAAGSALGRGAMAAGSAFGRGAAKAGSAFARKAAVAGGAFGRHAASAARATGRGLAGGSGAIGRASRAGFGKAAGVARPYVLRAGQRSFDVLEPALNALLRPTYSVPLTVVAVVAAAGAVIRGVTFGIDGDVIFAGTVAVVAALLVLVPKAMAGTLPAPLKAVGTGIGRGLAALRSRAAAAGRRSPAVRAVATLAVLAIAAGAAWYYWQPDVSSLLTAAAPSDQQRDDTPTVQVTRTPELKGRANVLAGDVIRVGQTTVRLAGIEAPEGNQRCNGASDRTWRCGQAARDALTRLTRGQQLSCRLAGTDDSGLRLATCSTGETDIAAELVRGGHVFAVPGFFARYSGVEGEARAARAGVWEADSVERPSEYRAKRWDEAKRNAPEGCPIKGRVTSGSRTYVLPWYSNYDSVRVRERRGERWFCSEQEARAAGWRPMSL